MKVVNIERKKSPYLLKDLRKFNENFRKDVSYDDIKIQKKAVFQPLDKKQIFQKTTGGIKPPAFLVLNSS